MKKWKDIGPKVLCDEREISTLRRMLRSQLDAPDRGCINTTFDQYRTAVANCIWSGVKRICAQGFKIPTTDRYAISLITGVADLWPDDKSSKRITCFLPDDYDFKKKQFKYSQSVKGLDSLPYSPLNIFYEYLPREKRPLWKVYKDKSLLMGRKDKEVLKYLGTHAEYRNIFTADKGKKRSAIIKQARTAFSKAGSHLWLFTFDTEREPSPYRTILVSTDEKDAHLNPEIRCWLNVFATILGEVAAVERKAMAFVASARASGRVVKSDPKHWVTLKDAHISWMKLAEFKSATERQRQVLAEILSLLPATDLHSAVDHTILTMPEYKAPSLCDAMMKLRAFGRDQRNVKRAFGNVLRKLDQSLYACPLIIKEANGDYIFPLKTIPTTPATQQEKERLLKERIEAYGKTHLAKFNSRRTSILAECDAREKSGEEHTRGSILTWSLIRSIYCNESLNISVKEYKKYRKRGGANSEWKERHSVRLIDTIDKVNWEALAPKALYLTHGDLHFKNILVNPADLDDPLFKLIDCSIDWQGRDRAEDYSRMCQSCDALWDFISEDLFEVDISRSEGGVWSAELTIGSIPKSSQISGGVSGANVLSYVDTKDQVGDYSAIANDFVLELSKRSKQDTKLPMRVRFIESMNLLSAPATFLPRHPHRALACAIMGVVLLTEWKNEFGTARKKSRRRSGANVLALSTR